MRLKLIIGAALFAGGLTASVWPSDTFSALDGATELNSSSLSGFVGGGTNTSCITEGQACVVGQTIPADCDWDEIGTNWDQCNHLPDKGCVSTPGTGNSNCAIGGGGTSPCTGTRGRCSDSTTGPVVIEVGNEVNGKWVPYNPCSGSAKTC